MTQTSNRLLDEFAKLMTDVAGVAQGVRREVETAFKSQAERFLARWISCSARSSRLCATWRRAPARRTNSLKKRIAALEEHLGRTPPEDGEPIKRGARKETGASGVEEAALSARSCFPVEKPRAAFAAASARELAYL